MKRSCGLTLTETLLAVVLTVILAAVAVAGLTGVRTWREAHAVRRVQNDLAAARQRALWTGRRTLVVLDVDNNRYEVYQEATPGDGQIDGTLLTHPATGEDWIVPLAQLAGSLQFEAPDPGTPDRVGFDTFGLPVSEDGQALTQDVQWNLNNGASLWIRAGSGVCEATWP